MITSGVGDPDPDIDPSLFVWILSSTNKKVEKNLDFYYGVTFF
jgi:hypothetical protein